MEGSCIPSKDGCGAYGINQDCCTASEHQSWQMERCAILILIEGIDRTGKSTLAERLATFTGGVVLHASKPEAHPIYEYTAYFANLSPARETFILDRGYVGESVWPLVFKRPSEMDEAVRRWVSMFFMSRGAVLIHAERNPFDEAIAQEFEEAEEPITTLTDITLAACLFREAVAESGLPVYPYRHGDWPGAALHDGARRAIVAGELLDITRRYVGSFAPRVLIVADQTEGHAMNFMPYPDTTGHFLLDELDCWRQCGLVNPTRLDGEGSEPVRALWYALGKPRIVTFGGAAADTVDLMGLDFDDYGPLSQFRSRLPKGSLREVVGRHL